MKFTGVESIFWVKFTCLEGTFWVKFTCVESILWVKFTNRTLVNTSLMEILASMHPVCCSKKDAYILKWYLL